LSFIRPEVRLLSKKHKAHGPVGLSLEELKERAQRARRESRFQQALELVKQLHKAQPTPATLELLKDTYIDRARQLRGQHQTRDAANMLEMAARIDEANASWLERLASEIALCGEPARAQALLARVPEPDRSGQVTAALADTAIVQEGAGRNTLSPALQADLDRVLLAFRQVEAGQDEAAKETLQPIGLRSPFLEWKLLLRGLQAYYQKDDTRALDNWQRLSADRPPARLAAPFRAQIDPGFRNAQPPATQTALAQQLDRLQTTALLPQLRNLRKAMANRDSLAQAFRLAEGLLPALRQEAPHLLPRLANSFYWAIIDTSPEDILRYKRVFGAPATDPNFNRLQALAYDRHDQPSGSHKYWQLYEKDIADHPEMWPNGQASHARALIWKHLGDNAARAVDAEGPLEQIRVILPGMPDAPARLSPPAEKCYQRSLELAPDMVEAHSALVDHLFDDGKSAKAEKAARKLLERFPNHLETLEQLGDYLLGSKPVEALELYQRALKNNPLQRDLRAKVGTAHLGAARADTLAGRFDAARAHFQSGLTLRGEHSAPFVLPRWAACEFKAGDAARAEELLQQARGHSTPDLVISYAMMAEVVALKLPAPLKKRFEAEVNAALKAPPTGKDAAALALLLLEHRAGQLEYHGQKTHVKKAMAFIDKAHNAPFNEKQLEVICEALIALEAGDRALKRYLKRGQREYPKNPVFPYREAVYLMTKMPEHRGLYNARFLLERADQLARARPKAEQDEEMLADIQQRLGAINAMSPFGGGNIFERLFETFGPFEEDEYWDD
jgi:hypothetical protein